MATKKKVYDGDIPFTTSGDQKHYPDVWQGLEWKPNSIFTDTLTYEGYGRGRSAAYMEFRRKSTNTTVVVFMTDFDPMVALMVNGQITADFTFCKRGMNFGCKLVEP